MIAPVLQEHLLSPGTANGAIWRYSPAHPKLYHFHGQFELLLVKRGFTVERVGVQLQQVHAGQLIWHLPGVAHEQVSASRDLDLRVVHIEPDLVPSLTQLAPYVAGRPVVELRRNDFDALQHYCEDTSDGGEDRSARVALAATIAFQATARDHDNARATSFPALACCLLLGDPSMTRTELCRALDVSGGYLSRQFQVELGAPLQEQRARLRVARFTTLATRERRNWLDAALSAGFGSYSQFYRTFTRLAGVGPREYLCEDGRNRLAVVPA